MESVGVNMLEIEVTNKCNLNCPHCYYYEDGEKGTDYNDFINLNAVDKLLNDVGIDYILDATFTGGEPLLAENEIIRILHKNIKSKNPIISVGIVTNGTILSENFAYEYNEYAKKMSDIITNHKNEYIRKLLGEGFPPLANFRISNTFHNNNVEKAYEFYKKRMPYVNIIDFRNDEVEDSIKTNLFYSGRAKMMKDNNFHCDSARHKIVYDEKISKKIGKRKEESIKCPLVMHYDGKISIASFCSRCHWDDNVIGSVFDGKPLREMITEWNFKTPLSCDEACQLEEFRMARDINNPEIFINKGGKIKRKVESILNQGYTIKQIGDYMENSMKFLEEYRLDMHKNIPILTTDELELISYDALALKEEVDYFSTDEKYDGAKNKLVTNLSKLLHEHEYDGTKDIHKKFPYLTSDECQKYRKCYENQEDIKCLAKCFQLEMLNNCRKEIIDGNIPYQKSQKIFDEIMDGNVNSKYLENDNLRKLAKIVSDLKLEEEQ